MREIEALVEVEGRWPGTDAERRAARHLEQRLAEMGRDAELEPTSVWPNYALTHLIHALLAIAGSVLAVSAPLPAALLVLVAAISAFGDLTGSFYLVRRLTGRRASQNVVSREDEGKPGVLILSAHYDAARSGVAFSRRATERRAVLGKLIRRQLGPFEPFFWAIMLVLVTVTLRLFEIEALPLAIAQFVPTVILIISVPLFADIALSDVVPGASDNASGVATVLRLAERYGGRLESFDVWVVLPGAEEALLLGMRSFVKRHKKELDPTSTVFLNVDTAGNGTVRWMKKEGLVFAYRFHPTLVELCEEVAEDDDEGYYGARAMVSRQATDALAARAAGYPAITITCRNALDYAPNYHQHTDTPERIEPEALERAYDFCGELIERLDETVGPRLEELARDNELSEERT